MRRSLRLLVALAFVALISLVSAGCGQSASSKTAGAGTQQATDRDMGVKFSECMRENGVGDFPDPNADGDYAYGVSVTPAVFSKAVGACKDLEPPGALSSKRSPKQQSASLRFAQCVRNNGVTDFPDPVDGEPLVNTYKIPSSNTPNGMTALNAALQSCRSLLDLAAGGQG